MIYKIGDRLKCKQQINTKCLDMTNPEFDIKIADIYVITDRDDYPDENDCHWYELTSDNDGKNVLNVWNDNPDHLVLDEHFSKL